MTPEQRKELEQLVSALHEEAEDIPGFRTAIEEDHARAAAVEKFTPEGLDHTEKMLFHSLLKNALVEEVNNAMSAEKKQTPEWVSLQHVLTHVRILGQMVAVHIVEIRRLRAELEQADMDRQAAWAMLGRKPN